MNKISATVYMLNCISLFMVPFGSSVTLTLLGSFGREGSRRIPVSHFPSQDRSLCYSSYRIASNLFKSHYGSHLVQCNEVLKECGLDQKLETIRNHEERSRPLSTLDGLQPEQLVGPLQLFDQKLLDLGSFSIPHINYLYSLSLREKVRRCLAFPNIRFVPNLPICSATTLGSFITLCLRITTSINTLTAFSVTIPTKYEL